MRDFFAESYIGFPASLQKDFFFQKKIKFIVNNTQPVSSTLIIIILFRRIYGPPFV